MALQLLRLTRLMPVRRCVTIFSNLSRRLARSNASATTDVVMLIAGRMIIIGMDQIPTALDAAQRLREHFRAIQRMTIPGLQREFRYIPEPNLNSPTTARIDAVERRMAELARHAGHTLASANYSAWQPPTQSFTQSAPAATATTSGDTPMFMHFTRWMPAVISNGVDLMRMMDFDGDALHLSVLAAGPPGTSMTYNLAALETLMNHNADFNAGDDEYPTTIQPVPAAAALNTYSSAA